MDSKEDKRFTHGLCGSRIYNIFMDMKKRCYNSNCLGFKNYGGRGIFICDEWLRNVEKFYNWSLENGYADNLSIDRINNDKGYSPDNCRWANRTQQRLNQRIHPCNTSGYTGVNYDKKNDKWRARIFFNNEQVFDYYNKDIILAVKARNNFIIENNLPHKISEVE